MSAGQRANTFDQHFKHDLAKESAGSLGRSGLRVEEALERLREAGLGPEEHEKRLKIAIEAVYFYFIQRELLGSTNHEEAIALYDIPDEVLKRLGAC